MISYLSGTVAEKGARFVTIDVHGVGYKVFTTDETLRLLKAGSSVKLLTHHVVREDAEDLFGFLETDDLKLFELLLSVPGIGPKTALNIFRPCLSSSSMLSLSSAVN